MFPRAMVTGLLLAAMALGSARSARAQGQENAPDLRQINPFMALIVDTSGSMERKPACTCADSACLNCLPNCDLPNTNGIAPPGKKNRFAVTLEALTGTVNNFECTALARTSENGATYDIGSALPYHQPWDCLGSPTEPCPYYGSSCNSSADCVSPYQYCTNVPNQGNRCTAISQNSDGVLDRYRSLIQFGLMTFDGWDTYVGAPPLVPVAEFNVDRSDDEPGLWSYGGPKEFHYPNCTVNYMMDTGFRSATASGGRLISLDTCTSSTDCPSWCPVAGCVTSSQDIMEQMNGVIQDSLLITRPYGGTPIAASLDDLYTHLKQDLNDPEFGSCRNRFAMLITDGYPDDDFRAYKCDCTQNTDPMGQFPDGRSNYCEGDDPAEMKCPYPTPEAAAQNLIQGKSGDLPQVEKVFVVGLAIDDDVVRQRLNDIAVAGGVEDLDGDGNEALFADDLDTLFSNLTTVFDSVISPLSRTVPAFISGGGSSTAAQFQVNAGFEKTENGLYSGIIERHRFTCDDADVVEEPLSESSGDLFHETLDSVTFNRNLKTARAINGPHDGYLFVGDTSAPCGDGGCTVVDLDDDTVTTTDLGLNVGDTTLRTDIFNWMYGRGGSLRDPGSGGRRLGDIWHSSPVIVAPPRVDTANEAFNMWRDRGESDSPPGPKDNPTVLYVSSNDGIIHAFSIDAHPPTGVATYAAGEEMWGFVPPLLLNKLQQNLTGHDFSMDGTPVVKHVYFEDKPSPTQTADEYHTVLVTGMRGGGQSYVALDVSVPDSPKFLWQFNDPHMGYSYPQPGVVQAIYRPYVAGVPGPAKNRAIAILPGGVGLLGPSGIPNDCVNGTTQPQMRQQNQAVFKTFSAIPGGGTVGTHSHRADVRCWQDLGRSLYFVDVETGELIKKIHLENPADPNSRRFFSSPLVSTPVVFREGVGEEATRAFVVDADGVIWRIDMSDLDPRPDEPKAGWTARPFHDIFWDRGPAQGELSYEKPILTTDDAGRLVVIVGTGDTQNFLKTTIENRVVSVTEVIDPGVTVPTGPEDYRAAFNWEKRAKPPGDATALVPSELVTGPLTLFNDQVYFGTFISAQSGGNACDVGKGRIFAVHYNKRDDADTNGSSPQTYGPVVFTNAAGDSDASTVVNVPASSAVDNLLIMGLQLASQPSCVIVDSDVSAISDIWGDSVAYIGPRGSSPPPQQYLVAMAAGGASLITGGGPVLPRIQVNVNRPTPTPTRVLSWGADVD